MMLDVVYPSCAVYPFPLNISFKTEIKGTVGEISKDPPIIKQHVRFTTLACQLH